MESNEPKKPSGFELSPAKDDLETGKVTFDVTYKADFPSLYNAFKNLNKEYKQFLLYDEVKTDLKFKEIYGGFKYLLNQYTSHMRENYPKQYSLLKAANENLLRELVQKHLKEMSATGAGVSAGTFTSGESENAAPKHAFNSNQKNYYYKLSGYKPVNAEKLEEETTDVYVNNLNLTDKALKDFIGTRMADFDKIEDKLNTLLPLLKSAKADTMEYYKTNPDFKIKYGTDLAVDYLDKILTLFKEKK
jgi:hypothetical protein